MTTSNDKYRCDYCHKDGHTEDRCYKNKRENATVIRSNLTQTALCIYETLICRAKESGYVNDTTFVADTGATSHVVNSTKYLTDITQISSDITMGNEDQFQCTKKGIFRGFFKAKHGKDTPIVLKDDLHVPMLAVKFLSITKCIIKQGVQFTANNRKLLSTIQGTQIKFNKEIRHVTGK
jgi:hypothetical protein